MGKLFRRLRIGEKIGFGFGLVGLLFLGVIWQYHSTLNQALRDYETLQDVYGTRKTLALAVETNMLEAQRLEKDFIFSRDETVAEDVVRYLDKARTAAERMASVDEQSAQMAMRLTRLLNDYGERFHAVVDAWRIKGLDHDSGLQGAFRDAAHQLEDMAEHFKVDRLYLVLLQIRRGEKDLGLRREDQYRDRVLKLVQDFSDETASSNLEPGIKARLFHEIEVYRKTFTEYAQEVLANNPIRGGKGPFRQTAHRIEGILNAQYVPELGERILQVRRREKDYLLRYDKQYVDMTLDQVSDIVSQVKAAAISDENKAQFLNLSRNYRRDFLALVEQNDRIVVLNDQMRSAVSEIVKLVRQNVDNANLAMDTTRDRVEGTTSQNERVILWTVIIATLLGIILAVAITLAIVRPLRAMADLLDRLASEEPAERIPYYSGGRDEVNAMAGSVNTMADHKANFIAWWKTSLREADACERLEALLSKASDADGFQDADQELRRALLARKELLWEQYHKVHQLNGWILERAEGLLEDAPSHRSEIALNTIRYSAKSVQTILETASFPDLREPKAG